MKKCVFLKFVCFRIWNWIEWWRWWQNWGDWGCQCHHSQVNDIHLYLDDHSVSWIELFSGCFMIFTVFGLLCLNKRAIVLNKINVTFYDVFLLITCELLQFPGWPTTTASRMGTRRWERRRRGCLPYHNLQSSMRVSCEQARKPWSCTLVQNYK